MGGKKRSSSSDDGRRVEFAALDDLKPAKKNPRVHDLPLLKEALIARGLGELPLVDERTGRLVAGHGRVKALKELRNEGASPPAGVRLDGKTWLVPVVRGWASKNDADAAAYLVGSNADHEWEAGKLDELLAEIAQSAGTEGLLGTGYNANDVEKLLRETSRVDEEREEPEAPSTGANLYVKEGDLWRLGKHAIICGDSHDEANRARLFAAVGEEQCAAVVTDPPFAIYGSATGIGSDVADDKMVRPYFTATFEAIRSRLPIWAHVYVCCDWRTYPTISDTAKKAGLSPKNCLVWDKGGSGLGSMWAQSHEFVAFFTLNPAPKAMKQSNGEERAARTVYKPNMLRFNRPHGDEREHNAAKPVAMLMEIIEAAADPEGLIWDLCCGSGSTLIAAEKSGRRCVTADLEPKWVQVTIERWQRLTGEKAERV